MNDQEKIADLESKLNSYQIGMGLIGMKAGEQVGDMLDAAEMLEKWTNGASELENRQLRAGIIERLKAGAAALAGYAPASLYDGAVAAIAPFLADGWITQDGDEGDGLVVSFTGIKREEPTVYKDEKDDAEFWKADPMADGVFNLPVCEDWKQSKRKIVGGKVVEL